MCEGVRDYRPIGITLMALALSACNGNVAPFAAGLASGINNAPSWQPLYVQAPAQPQSIHCIQIRPGYQSCSAQ